MKIVKPHIYPKDCKGCRYLLPSGLACSAHQLALKEIEECAGYDAVDE